VLITQCLQRDFVGLIGPHDPLPDALHIGPAEALRLVGSEPEVGPVGQLLSWARAQAPGTLDVIHIRDAHDPTDPRQADHLRTFGRHCVRGEPGAELVFGASDAPGPHEVFVDATGLNDVYDTTLTAELQRVSAAAGVPLRIGVVGVWTDAKVNFLLYDLKTRLGFDALSTCSALTASASRVQHFNALEQLRRILGVEVFDSVGEFLAWLHPDSPQTPAITRPQAGAGARVEVTEGEAPSPDDEAIVQHLYRTSARVELHPIGGGFSGARVFRAVSWDPFGHEQAPSVVKLGSNRTIGAERIAFEKVESILGNSAPSVRGFVDFGARAGIRYSYAAMGRGRIRTLKSLFEHDTPIDQLREVIRTVFDEVFAPFFAAARYEQLPLFVHYGFARLEVTDAGPRVVPELRYAARVRASVEAVLGGPAGPTMRLLDGTEVRSPTWFYEDLLPSGAFPGADGHYVATVHGDLNGANILLDSRDNVWVIDFFHTGPGHVWKDLIKLENDLLFLFTPLQDEEDLLEALRLTAALRAVQDLRAPLPETVPGLTRPALIRAWAMVRELRSIGGELTMEDRHPWQVAIGLLRYAVHTLTFDEASPLQKRWALASAGVWCSELATGLVSQRRLRPGWVALDDLGLPAGAALGVVLCPGRRDRDRQLDDDLAVLVEDGVSWLLGVMTTAELRWADVAALPQRSAALGLPYTLLPVPDQQAPSLAEAEGAVAAALDRLRRGERVVFHCLGGLGRSGTVAACVLTALGLSPEAAVARVRVARGPRAVETEAQQAFVARFAEARRSGIA